MGKNLGYKMRRRVEKPETPKRDSPLIKKNILDNSLSDEFEEARREWEFVSIIYDTEEPFVDHCEICNAAGLETNYKIVNKYTGKAFLVGSSCIRKFIILSGAQSQEESNLIFDRQIKKREASRYLQILLPKILDIPTMNELNKFRNVSKIILGSLDNKLVQPYLWDEYITLLFGTKEPAKLPQVQRVKQALFEPRAIPVRKVDLTTGLKDGNWAGTIRAKTRVETSLARSEAYHVERDD